MKHILMIGAVVSSFFSIHAMQMQGQGKLEPGFISIANNLPSGESIIGEIRIKVGFVDKQGKPLAYENEWKSGSVKIKNPEPGQTYVVDLKKAAKALYNPSYQKIGEENVFSTIKQECSMVIIKIVIKARNGDLLFEKKYASRKKDLGDPCAPKAVAWILAKNEQGTVTIAPTTSQS